MNLLAGCIWKALLCVVELLKPNKKKVFIQNVVSINNEAFSTQGGSFRVICRAYTINGSWWFMLDSNCHCMLL
jgi:hypothetical protein